MSNYLKDVFPLDSYLLSNYEHVKYTTYERENGLFCK